MQKYSFQQKHGNSTTEQLLLQIGYVENVNKSGQREIIEINLYLHLVNMPGWAEISYLQPFTGETPAQTVPIMCWNNARCCLIRDTCFNIITNDLLRIRLRKSFISAQSSAEQIKLKGFWL